MDGNGFNNAAMETKHINVIFMGSSHMEAMNVNTNQNVCSLFRNRMSDMNCYNIGISGHSIYSCINNIHAVAQTYNPDKYVIIETASVDMDIDAMKEVIDGTAGKIPSYDSGFIYMLQKIPAIKWIYKGCTNWINHSLEKNTTDAVTDDNLNEADYASVLNEFLDIEDLDCNAKVIIFYQPNTQIDSSGNFILPNESEVRRINEFAEACSNNGIEFIDMTDEFLKLYEQDYILAHGFINTAVGEGHLNKHGHRVIADKLVSVVEGLEAQ